MIVANYSDGYSCFLSLYSDFYKILSNSSITINFNLYNDVRSLSYVFLIIFFIRPTHPNNILTFGLILLQSTFVFINHLRNDIFMKLIF